MKLPAVFATSMMLCSTAVAAPVIRGIGTGSCAEFASTYKKNPRLADLVYGSWEQDLCLA